MSDILVSGVAYISTPQACIVDLTPPTFAGLGSALVQSRGQIRVEYAAGSDAINPIRYEIYIKAGTNTNLFNTSNIVASTDKLLYDIFFLPDGSLLQNGTEYFVGVRAVDAVGNRDNNTVNDSVISTGINMSSDIFEVNGAFAIDNDNNIIGTLWLLKNSVLANTSTVGTASYEIFDKSGVSTGISESGIVKNSEGQFVITPVTSTLSESLDLYVVRIDIQADSQVRTGYVSIIKKEPIYDLDGVFSINEDNELEATFWVKANEIIKTTGIGTASYEIYDKTGALVSGMSESGIVADSNGLYKITPVGSTLQSILTHYAVKIIIEVDGVNRSEFLGIQGVIPNYDVKAVFSINALNQLQASFWVASNSIVKTSNLGTASYQIYDASGSAVAGLTQSGITADANGLFNINPISAVLLTDLTHYTARITIQADSVNRVGYKSFTLLGN